MKINHKSFTEYSNVEMYWYLHKYESNRNHENADHQKIRLVSTSGIFYNLYIEMLIVEFVVVCST